MRLIPQCQLRNHMNQVLRQVEAGEHLRVTVDGRPVADLMPVGGARRTFVPRGEVTQLLARAPLDPALARDMEAATSATVDELGPRRRRLWADAGCSIPPSLSPRRAAVPRRLPAEAAISVITVAELHLGMLMADDTAIRPQRLRTLSSVEALFEPVPIEAAVGRTFAELVAEARRQGRRPKVLDTFIAATAVAHDLPVYTQDDDFCALPRVRVLRV